MQTRTRYSMALAGLLTAAFSTAPSWAQQAGASYKATPQISIADARAVALRQIPGQLLEEELGREGGKLVYSFEIRPQAAKSGSTEVKVDANTGKVLSIGKDSEDEGGRDEPEEHHR